MRRNRNGRRFPILLAAALLAGCASKRLADEPADLVARGRSVAALTELGWDVAAPMSAADIAADSKLDASFRARLAAGDEVRPVRNNAGIGYAIFRDGVLVELFLTGSSQS